MPLYMQGNKMFNVGIGVSMPEDMVAWLIENEFTGGKIAVEVRDKPIKMLKDGFPHDAYQDLLIQLRANHDASEADRFKVINDHPICSWLQPGVTVIEFATAVLSFISSIS